MLEAVSTTDLYTTLVGRGRRPSIVTVSWPVFRVTSSVLTVGITGNGDASSSYNLISLILAWPIPLVAVTVTRTAAKGPMSSAALVEAACLGFTRGLSGSGARPMSEALVASRQRPADMI